MSGRLAPPLCFCLVSILILASIHHSLRQLLPRSGDGARRLAGDEQSARDSQPRWLPASGTARGSAHPPMASNQGVLHSCPLAKYAMAFPRMFALHGHPRQLGLQTADLQLLGGHLRPAVGPLQRAFPMSLDLVEQPSALPHPTVAMPPLYSGPTQPAEPPLA